MTRLRINVKAQRHILDVYEQLEDIQVGLGDRFELELYHFFDLIESNP